MGKSGMTFTNDVTWEHEEGSIVSGVLLDMTEMETVNGFVKLWMLDTGETVEQHVFNDSLYELVKNKLTLGSKITVEYKGKKELEGNKSLKIFKLDVPDWNESGQVLVSLFKQSQGTAEKTPE